MPENSSFFKRVIVLIVLTIGIVYGTKGAVWAVDCRTIVENGGRVAWERNGDRLRPWRPIFIGARAGRQSPVSLLPMHRIIGCAEQVGWF